MLFLYIYIMLLMYILNNVVSVYIHNSSNVYSE